MPSNKPLPEIYLAAKPDMELDPNFVRTIEFIERGGRTQRCHTQPIIRQQNVADHSFGVAWWCYLLSPLRRPSAELLLTALAHDMAEHETGDVPSPTKEVLGIRPMLNAYEDRLMAEHTLVMPGITEDEKRILKLADSLELMQLCLRERTMGNRSKQIGEMWDKISGYAFAKCKRNVDAQAFEIISQQWKALP